jgi:tetratricopeptide (TPR) repeat protein
MPLQFFYPHARIFSLAIFVGWAMSARAHGDLHGRIVAITSELATNQNQAALWLQRADLRRQHGEFVEAQSDLNYAAQLHPNWSAVDLQRARLAFDCGNFPAAIRAAGNCLLRDTNNADARVLRARSLVTLARRDELERNSNTSSATKLAEAVVDYDAVLNQTNSAAPLPDLFLERAQVLAELKNYPAAVRGLEDAMQKFGVTPSFALPAIEYERQQGAFTSALVRLERAQTFFDRESFLALRGEIQLQAGNHSEAEKDFTTALATLEKFSPERRAHSTDLEARLRNGLRQATVKPIQKAVQKTPTVTR